MILSNKILFKDQKGFNFLKVDKNNEEEYGFGLCFSYNFKSKFFCIYHSAFWAKFDDTCFSFH